MKDLAAPPPMPTSIEVEIVTETYFEVPPCFKFDGAWPEDHRNYLKEERGILDQAVDWGIGYVTRCDCLKRRHRDRVVLPVLSEDGRVVSYTCRTAVDNPVRYVEPKTEENADKAALYGAHLLRGVKRAFVVEGPFDAIATHACIKKLKLEGVAAVALRGSSPSTTVLERLSRFDTIYAMTDPDVAGRKALEALQTLGRHTKIVPVELPEKEDPSSLYFTSEHRDSKRSILFEIMTRCLST